MRIKYVLEHDERIRFYYFNTYGVTESMFNSMTCMDYSFDGLGEVADAILRDGNYLFQRVAVC